MNGEGHRQKANECGVRRRGAEGAKLVVAVGPKWWRSMRWTKMLKGCNHTLERR